MYMKNCMEWEIPAEHYPVATMDLSTSQEVMGVQSRYEYAHHVFKSKEIFDETDIQGNNNLFNTLKTEPSSNHGHDSSSLFQVKCQNENKYEVDNALFSYSTFKKAMDLRTQNRSLDGVKRTIFDDAEYFAKNYCYKLLPITLEPVDETVIQSEHNYSLMSLNSESEPEENCSRTMDYSQIKEKNYKRRRTKFRDGSDIDEELLECDTSGGAANGFHSPPILQLNDKSLSANEEYQNASKDLKDPEDDHSLAVQPLDLSAPLVVQEQKTDSFLRESPSSIVENAEVAQPDSDKENVISELNGILVTISGPGEKENYQPCDLFLNDIARLVPRLIDKDCVEVNILDRTCDRHDQYPKHRLYYVISESTWMLFQKTNERVILTNDQSLGQPLRKAEKNGKPSYLVFDQFSLAKYLADYCQEIGGCFEYTCVEEEMEEECTRGNDDEVVEKMLETVDKAGVKNDEIGCWAQKEPKKEIIEEVSQTSDGIKDLIEVVSEQLTEELKETEQDSSELDETSQKKSANPEEGKSAEMKVPPSESEENVEKSKNAKQSASSREMQEKQMETPEHMSPETADIKDKNEVKKQSRGTKRKRKSSIQRKPKNSRIIPRTKATSESETSQKSDKPVSRKGKREPTFSKKEPANKGVKQAAPGEPANKCSKQATPEKPAKKGSKQTAPEKLANKGSEQAAPGEPEKKASKQAAPEKPANKRSKQAALEKPANKRSKQAALEKPANKLSKQAVLEKPAKKGSKQTVLEKPVKKGGKQDALEKPVKKGSKQDALEKPANKSSKQSAPEEASRRTRSAKVLQEVKTNRLTLRKKGLKKRNASKKEIMSEEKKKTEERGSRIGRRGSRLVVNQRQEKVALKMGS